MMRDPARAIVGMDVGGANLKYALVSRAMGNRSGSADQHASVERQQAGPQGCSHSVRDRHGGSTRERSDCTGSERRQSGQSETVLGSSVGKLARVWSSPFPMWIRFQGLADQLVEELRGHADTQPFNSFAVTMTGELADCFIDRAEGVRHIVEHVCQAARRLQVEHVFFYGVDGRFHTPEETVQRVDCVAAANWHALGSFVANTFCSDGILVDVGSTTTDIIPLKQGTVATAASTDHERLAEGSLVYLGGSRTPIASLVDQLWHEGRWIPVMREWFATMDDVRLLLGWTAADPNDHQSADGKPRVADLAANRLARMIGLDRRHVSQEQAVQLATQVHRVARQRISDAVARLCRQSGNPNAWIISGHAPDLIETPSGSSVICLRDSLGEQAARSAPAVAVANQLLCEQSGLLESCGG